MFQKYLLHDKLLVRFGGLLASIFVIFLGAWTISYFFLPEGVLVGEDCGTSTGRR